MFETIMLSVAFIVVISFCAAFAFWLRGWRKVFPIVIGTIVLILGIWYFGWLYGLWAFLAIVALGALFWAMIRPSWRVLHYIFGLIFVLIIAVGIALVFLSAMALTPLVTTSEPVVENTSTSAVNTATCTEAVSVASQVHGGKVEVDLNDGDPFDYSLTIVNPDVPQGDKTLVVLAEPGHIFDVVHPVMYFTSYRLQGTLDQAICSAKKLAGNASAYVFVGEAKTPEGWTTVSETQGWWTELVAKQYSEPALTPGGDWTAVQIADDDSNRDLKSENLIYGQLWNPNVGGVVVHFQIENDYTLTIPVGWQGTYWTVTGADPIIVQDRFVQASKEVIERDALSLKNVTLLYCGAHTPTTELVIGSDSLKWATTLEGWTCEVTK